MFYKNDDNRDDFPKVFKWTVFSLCILIITFIIFRSISITIPKELQNYLAKNYEEYINRNDDFKIIEINANNRFSLDKQNPLEYSDALFIETIYYLEDIKKLQIVLRYKNMEIQPIILNSEEPFVACLSNNTLNDNSNIEWKDWTAEWTSWYDVSSNPTIFGKSTDKYQYFVYSFDNVAIDYGLSMVTLQVFINNNKEVKEIVTNKENELGQFTIYTGEKLQFMLSQ